MPEPAGKKGHLKCSPTHFLVIKSQMNAKSKKKSTRRGRAEGNELLTRFNVNSKQTPVHFHVIFPSLPNVLANHPGAWI